MIYNLFYTTILFILKIVEFNRYRIVFRYKYKLLIYIAYFFLKIIKHHCLHFGTAFALNLTKLKIY